MATNTLNDFMKWVLPDVHGCPVAVAEQAVLDSSIMFCEEARAHRAQLDDITLVSATATYTVVTPTDTVISSIIYAGVDGTEVFRSTRDRIQLQVPTWRTETGTPTHVIMDDPRTIRTVPVPTGAGTLVLEAYLKPAADAATVQDFIYEEWHEAIAYGAKARLFSMAEKPWTSQNKAESNAIAYASAITAAVSKNDTGHMRPSRRVRYGGL